VDTKKSHVERVTDRCVSFARRQARDLDLDNKPRAEGNSRFALQKLNTTETVARAKESVVRT